MPKLYNIKQKDARKLLEYSTIFLMIFVSVDTMMFGTPKIEVFRFVAMGIMVFLCLVWFVLMVKEDKIINQRALIVVTMLILLTIITLTKSVQKVQHSLYLMLILCFAYIVVVNISRDSFEKKFINIMVFLSVFSLVGFIAYKIFGNKISMFSIANINDMQFDSLFFTHFYFDPNDQYRNWGIFREPGVYQIFLNIALVFNLKNKGLKSWVVSIILIVTSFTTLSTAGILITVAIVGVWLMFTKDINIGAKAMILVAIFVAAALIVLIPSSLSDKIINKFSGFFLKFNIKNVSFISRFSSFPKNFYLWLNAPIFGNGFAYMIENYGIFMVDVYGDGGFHNTNTLFKLFSTHGIFFGGIVTYGFFKFFGDSEKSKIQGFLYAIVMAFCFSNEDLTLNPVLFIILFYAIIYKRNNNALKHKTRRAYESLPY